MDIRVGHGYDVHRLGENRRLIIGGVEIPYDRGLIGHSDADVLLHAVTDALLGAIALGDIGGLFPDNNPDYKGADSLILLKTAYSLILEKGYVVGNIDATIVAQAPKMAGYITEMRENIAAALSCSADRINVKATTEEFLGFTGEGLGIAAHCCCLVKKESEKF